VGGVGRKVGGRGKRREVTRGVLRKIEMKR
jgi:hypothetical protein